MDPWRMCGGKNYKKTKKRFKVRAISSGRGSPRKRCRMVADLGKRRRVWPFSARIITNLY